jgi:ArpU family phage transcriptional regulator
VAGIVGVIVVNLISQIDEEKTINKTKVFLEENLPDIISFSGMPLSDLSSPRLDPAGIAGGSNVNNTDKNILKSVHKLRAIQIYKYAMNAVLETINSCPDTERKPYKRILFRKYIKNDFDQWIYNDLHISKSTFNRLKNKAVLEFAKRAESYRMKYAQYDDAVSVLFYGTVVSR